MAFEGGTATDPIWSSEAEALSEQRGGYAGFEDQIIGHGTGRRIRYRSEVFGFLSGEQMWQEKVARFHIVLNEILQTKNIPELTDEWVASNSKIRQKQRTNTAKKSVNRLKALGDSK